MKKSKNFRENERDFNDTCIMVETQETENYFFKICPFGELRLHKKSGRISTASKYK